METFSGLIIDPLNLQSDQILIEDIAHALAFQCRFNGHCKYFYSIAQHSVLVANFCGNTLYSSMVRLFGLLHDAAEAYLGDMISPLKNVIPEYKNYEIIIRDQIFTKFCGRTQNDSEQRLIKTIDTRLLLTEALILMPSCGENWRNDMIPFPIKFSCQTPIMAEQTFLQRFKRLNKIHGENK